MKDKDSSLFDEYELPINRKKKVFEDLDNLSNEPVPFLITNSKKEKKEKDKEDEDNEDTASMWLTTLTTLSNNKIRTKSVKNIFAEDGGKKKKNKHKKKDELTDYNKEFETEGALLNNLLVDQNRFVESLQSKYDAMNSRKTTSSGLGKFTTDLISTLTQARQLSVSLVKEKIGLKKTIAELAMKEAKEKGLGGLEGEDLNTYAAQYLKGIISNRGAIINDSDNLNVDDMDDDAFASAIGNIDLGEIDNRGDDVDAYLKYENQDVKLSVLVNQDDLDDYEYIATDSNGNVISDYPLPIQSKLSLNRSTMIATDEYGRKYNARFK